MPKNLHIIFIMTYYKGWPIPKYLAQNKSRFVFQAFFLFHYALLNINIHLHSNTRLQRTERRQPTTGMASIWQARCYLHQPSFFIIIMCLFWVHSSAVRQSHNLHNVSMIFPVPHLAPYIVITISSTLFPMPYLLPCDSFEATNLSFLVPSPLLRSVPTSLPVFSLYPPVFLAPTSFLSVSMVLLQSCLFIYFVLQIPHITEVLWYLSFFN